MQTQWTVGIDLGGTNLKVGLVGADGTLHEVASRPTEAAKGPEYFCATVLKMVEELLARDGSPRTAILGAGIGSPGPLDLKNGIVLKAANLSGWVKAPLRERLAQTLCTNIVLENDANAAAYGEYFSTGRNTKHLVLLTLGTGVGGGVIIDGKVLHGHFDNAGELGHMIAVPGGLACPCGQRGCLEAYSSAGAVARALELALSNGEKSSALRGSDARLIANAAQAGDTLCKRIWDEACRYLALACINIQHAYNPEVILLGGGMAGAGQFLLDSVHNSFRANQWHLHDDYPRIELARLGADAGVIGAGCLAWTALPEFQAEL